MSCVVSWFPCVLCTTGQLFSWFLVSLCGLVVIVVRVFIVVVVVVLQITMMVIKYLVTITHDILLSTKLFTSEIIFLNDLILDILKIKSNCIYSTDYVITQNKKLEQEKIISDFASAISFIFLKFLA